MFGVNGRTSCWSEVRRASGESERRKHGAGKKLWMEAELNSMEKVINQSWQDENRTSGNGERRSLLTWHTCLDAKFY